MKVPEPKKCSTGWRIQLRLGGRSTYITAPSAKECKRRAELYKAQYLSDTTPTSARTVTYRQAAQNYIASKSNVLSPETIIGYNNMKNHRFLEVSNRPMIEVDWQAAINEEATRLSPKSVANAWGFVVSLMQTNSVPVPSVTLPQKVPNEHPWLTPEQIPVFLNAIRGRSLELPALLGLHGLRRSEIFALTPDSFSDNVIHVRGAVVRNTDGQFVYKETNKNTSSRRDVPIMIPRLNELLKEKPEFFSITAAHFGRGVDRVCESVGLPHVGAHGLRHSFASLCYHAGLSEAETMRLGGWSDPATMRKIYTHISEADIKQANKKLSSYFQSLK